jgi:hypothetical protein
VEQQAEQAEQGVLDDPPVRVCDTQSWSTSGLIPVLCYREQMADEADASDSKDQDQEPSNLYDLANSILAECKDAAPLLDLETAIYLFREALDRRPVPHPLRSDSLDDLSEALVTRFIQTNQRQDLEEAILLHGEVVSQLYSVLEGTAGVESQFQPEVRIWSDSDDYDWSSHPL